jgi:hypothetical protein
MEPALPPAARAVPTTAARLAAISVMSVIYVLRVGAPTAATPAQRSTT